VPDGEERKVKERHGGIKKKTRKEKTHVNVKKRIRVISLPFELALVLTASRQQADTLRQ